MKKTNANKVSKLLNELLESYKKNKQLLAPHEIATLVDAAIALDNFLDN